VADGGGDGLGYVSCNLQPARYERRRKMSMRAMTAMITGTRGGDHEEDRFGRRFGEMYLQSERYERWRKMH